MSFTLTKPRRLCLFRVLLDACPCCFLQYTAYLPVAIAVFFLFRGLVKRCPSPTLLWSMSHFSCHWKPSLLKVYWGMWRHSCLFIYSSSGQCSSPTLWSSGCPALFATCLFFSGACLLFRFFSFFPGWGSVCPEGYADLFQGCLWEYCLPLSSLGGLLLPSRIGAGVLWPGSPPGFSI
jgi:hypothetical protein